MGKGVRTLEGYHGTHKSIAKLIKEKHFDEKRASNGGWLGKGVYFFIEGGICKGPLHNADCFAKKKARKSNNEEPVVLKCILSAHEDNILDLNDKGDLRLYNEFKDQYLKDFVPNNGKSDMKKFYKFMDANLLTVIRKEIEDLDIVVRDMYEWLEGDELMHKAQSNIPNTTQMSVSNAKKYLQLEDIEIC